MLISGCILIVLGILYTIVYKFLKKSTPSPYTPVSPSAPPFPNDKILPSAPPFPNDKILPYVPPFPNDKKINYASVA